MSKRGRTTIQGLAAIALLVFLAAPVAAQQTTERFIPIGQSPGVSGKYSYIGEIVAVDQAGGTLTVRDNAGRHTLKLTEKTNLWIDRSGTRQRNLTAARSDCQVGRKVEVMHTHDDKNTAKWVKIAE